MLIFLQRSLCNFPVGNSCSTSRTCNILRNFPQLQMSVYCSYYDVYMYIYSDCRHYSKHSSVFCSLVHSQYIYSFYYCITKYLYVNEIKTLLKTNGNTLQSMCLTYRRRSNGTFQIFEVRYGKLKLVFHLYCYISGKKEVDDKFLLQILAGDTSCG